MPGEKRFSFMVVLLFVSCLLISCGGGGGGGGGGGIGETYPTAITVTDPSDSDLIEISTPTPSGDTHQRNIPCNQIVLMFDDGVSHDAARTIIDQMISDLAEFGLRLGGQIPELGIFQMIFDNTPEDSDSLERLDGLLERLDAYAGVDTASYNEIFNYDFMETVYDDDNTDIPGDERSPFSVIDYYQAIPVFEEIRGELTFNPVTVAIIDSGIDLSYRQFDDVQGIGGFEFIDIANPSAVASDPHTTQHGTAAASLIASDNEDGVINGLALRVLEHQMHFLVATLWPSAHQIRALASAQEVVNRGASVVNMSFSWHVGGSTATEVLILQHQFRRIFQRNPDVLYVCSAPNEPTLNINGNAVPAGMGEPNLITVGGVVSETFNTVAPQSATGPGIETSAPAVEVPVCCGSFSSYKVMSGNSFAAPMVTSMAAIIRSLAPSLSAADLKTFLLDANNNYSAPSDVGGRRPALLKTVGNAILQLTSSNSNIDHIIDRVRDRPDNLTDAPASCISQLLSEYEFSVDGPSYSRHYTVSVGQIPWVLTSAESNALWDSGLELWLAYDNDLVRFNTTSPFRLRSFTIGGDATMLVAADGAEARYAGNGISGTLTFTECEITTRSSPLDGFDIMSHPVEDWVGIEIAGFVSGARAEGSLLTDPITTPVFYDVSGTFTKHFALHLVSEPLIQYLEQVCEGGYQLP